MIEAVVETTTGGNEDIIAGAGVGSGGRKTETGGETGVTEQCARRDEWDAIQPCLESAIWRLFDESAFPPPTKISQNYSATFSSLWCHGFLAHLGLLCKS